MSGLETVLGYVFRDPGLLEVALTHSSYANEHRGLSHNERLEFLGDAVLELSASAYLYQQFPGEPEGNLSRRRAALVCEASLSACARRLNLGRSLRLGKGEDKSGGREKDSLLADAMEAVIGAIYLDGGWEKACAFIWHHLLVGRSEGGVPLDAKTRLQEYLQREGGIEIRYQDVPPSAEDAEGIFISEVSAEGKVLGRGSGHSKKSAEQDAAQAALKDLLPGENPPM